MTAAITVMVVAAVVAVTTDVQLGAKAGLAMIFGGGVGYLFGALLEHRGRP